MQMCYELNILYPYSITINEVLYPYSITNIVLLLVY